MTQTPSEYKYARSPSSNQEQIMRSHYFQTVKDILCSLSLGYGLHATDEEICDRAIKLTDKLIEKVGEKL